MPTLVSLVFLRGSRSELVGSQRGANANVPVRCIAIRDRADVCSWYISEVARRPLCGRFREESGSRITSEE